MSDKIEFPVHAKWTIHVDADDVISGLGNDDDSILTFVCQVIARAGSSDLREHLLARLGVFIDAEGVRYEPKTWDDDEFLSPSAPINDPSYGTKED